MIHLLYQDDLWYITNDLSRYYMSDTLLSLFWSPLIIDELVKSDTIC